MDRNSQHPTEPGTQRTGALELDPLDAILASEEPLLPSSGFLAAVMDRVEEESRTPASIPFPWKRALPGIILAAAFFAWAAVELVRQAIPALKQAPQILADIPATLPSALSLPLRSAGWLALALGLSLASWLFSSRLTSRSSLL